MKIATENAKADTDRAGMAARVALRMYPSTANIRSPEICTSEEKFKNGCEST